MDAALDIQSLVVLENNVEVSMTSPLLPCITIVAFAMLLCKLKMKGRQQDEETCTAAHVSSERSVYRLSISYSISHFNIDYGGANSLIQCQRTESRSLAII